MPIGDHAAQIPRIGIVGRADQVRIDERGGTAQVSLTQQLTCLRKVRFYWRSRVSMNCISRRSASGLDWRG